MNMMGSVAPASVLQESIATHPVARDVAENSSEKTQMGPPAATDQIKWDPSVHVLLSPITAHKTGHGTSWPGRLTYSLMASHGTHNLKYISCFSDRVASPVMYTHSIHSRIKPENRGLIPS